MFCTTFIGNTSHSQISNFVKIRPEGAELYHADGRKNERADRRMDIKKLIVVFRNFATAPALRMRLMNGILQ
jgi:hypothetical protein